MLTSFTSSFSSASPGELALSAGLAVLFAALGYRMSARHRALRGVTPWRVPSIAWAIICLFLQFIGIAIEIFAELTTRSPYTQATQPQTGPSPHLNAQAPGQSRERFGPPSSPPVSYQPPALSWPPPSEAARVGAELQATPIAPVKPELAPPPPDEHGRAAGFGWYRDPLGRHELRYFDGKHWSDHVVDEKALSSDPI